MSQLFASGSRSIAASASTTVFPMNIQGIIFKKKKKEVLPLHIIPQKNRNKHAPFYLHLVLR